MTATSKKTILIVEDEILVALDIGEALKEHGFGVLSVTTAAEGYGIAASGGCDAVLLDHGLTGDDSGPLADFLLAQGIPFAFCTGLAVSEVTARYPGVPLIEKPFRPDELIGVASAFFASRAAA